MAVNDPTTEQPNLLGDPPNARDTITTAIVQPEVLAVLLKAMDEQETPIDAAVPLETGFLEAVDKYLRKRIGPLPWVRHTLQGTCTAVGSGTCTMAVAGIDAPVTGVLYGPNRPTVGDRYPVRFPVALPPEGILLAKGPVPFGPPWIKVQGGETWLYYLGWTGTAFALYRVGLPPMDDPSFAYDPETVLHIGDVDTFAHGDDPPHHLTATFRSNLVWTDVHRWDSQPTPEDAPATLPWVTNLHRYQELGTFGPPAQTTDVTPSSPHIEMDGANLSLDAEGDYLLGIRAYSQQVPEIPTRPDLTPSQRGKDLLFDLVWSDGGATWAVVQSDFCYLKNIWTFNPGAGFYQGTFRWATAAIVGAMGWVADSATPWGASGARVHVWAVNERDDEPYPAGSRLDGNQADARALVAGYLTANVPQVRYYVSSEGGPAVRHALPLPGGWLGVAGRGEAGLLSGASFPGPAQRLRPFAFGTLGGQRLWAWWLGHESQSQNPATQVITGTAIHLWYGEGNQDGSEWTWTIREPAANVDQIHTVNAAGTTLIVSVLTDPNHFVSVYYFSSDAGVTWRTLPAPPFWFDAYQRPQLWLLDTP
jgi:hypothetical protein